MSGGHFTRIRSKGCLSCLPLSVVLSSWEFLWSCRRLDSRRIFKFLKVSLHPGFRAPTLEFLSPVSLLRAHCLCPNTGIQFFTHFSGVSAFVLHHLHQGKLCPVFSILTKNGPRAKSTNDRDGLNFLTPLRNFYLLGLRSHPYC